MPAQPHVNEKGKTVYSPVNNEGVPLYNYEYVELGDDHRMLVSAFLTDGEVDSLLLDPEVVVKPARILLRSQGVAESTAARNIRWGKEDSQGRPYN